MQEVVVRMRRVSEDLREIRTRLEHIRQTHCADRQVVDELLQLDLIREFKTSLDEVRNFLWDYFHEMSMLHEQHHEDALGDFRLKRATEMLRSVQDDIVVPVSTQTTEVRSLFERLQQIADVTVDRHFARKQ